MPEETNGNRNVTKGNVKKKDELRLFDIFFAGDWKTSLKIAFGEVIVPKIADMIVDSFNAAVRALVYGEGYTPTSSRTSNGSTYTNYQARSQDRRVPARVSDRYNVSELIFDDRMDAENVLDKLYDCIGQYQIATVFDFYDFAGVDTRPTDRGYGWTNIRNARVDRVRDGYVIRLPKPQPID